MTIQPFESQTPLGSGTAPEAVIAASRDAPEADQLPPVPPQLPRRRLLLRNPPDHTASKVLAVVGGVLVVMGLASLLFFTLGVLALLAAIGLVIFREFYSREHHANQQADHDALVRAQTQHLQADFDQRWQWWAYTRPLAVLVRARDGLAELRRYISSEASLYLGVAPDSKALILAPRDHSMLLLAPTRRGKTRRLVNPSAAAHCGALVMVSTKPDAYQYTVDERARLGRVWLFDPTSVTPPPPGVSQLRYSPLATCTSWDNTLLTAAAMVGASPMGGEGQATGANAYWTETAQTYLGPLMFAAWLHPDTSIVDAVRWANSGDTDTPALILGAVADDDTSPHCVGASIAIEQLERFSRFDDRHLNGIVGTAQAIFRAYNGEAVRRNCREINFDVDAFVRSADTVYITSKSRSQASVAPLIAAFLEHVQTATYGYNEAEDFMASGRPPVLMIIDEAANAAPVKELPRFVSEGGSQGLQIVVCLQSLSQTKIPWPVQGKALIEYFPIVMATGGLSDPETLEALSVLTGDEYREYRSDTHGSSSTQGTSTQWGRSWAPLDFLHPSQRTEGGGTSDSWSSSSSETTSQQKQRRMSPGDIAAIPFGQAFLYADTRFRLIDMVGVEHPAWQAVLRSSPTTPESAGPLPPALRPHGLADLPSIDELRLAYERRRQARLDNYAEQRNS